MARLLCMICKKVLDKNYPTEFDSHGLCDDCLDKKLAEIERINEPIEDNALLEN